ncbi:MAG TPA: hypothetical protein VHK70_04695 [Burkholderiaceae bacterium]|nr:hypothetical protein [Burkholderiaceae bacterium]
MRKWILAWMGCLLALLPLATPAAPALQAFEPDSLTPLIASQQGRPFVLIVWSLDCTYCQVSLKTLAEMQRAHRTLRVVTLSTDPLEHEEAAAQVKQRLASLGLRGPAWAFGAAPPEQLHYAIDPRWRGEKPRSYWFDAHGGKTAYSGLITRERIEQFLAQP